MLKTSKTKQVIRPIAFNDGICSIWTLEKNHLKTKLGEFDFHEDTLGINTFHELGLLGKQVDRVISIPYQTLIDQSFAVVIESKAYYVITIQKKDTFPMSLKLTLEKTPIKVGDAQ